MTADPFPDPFRPEFEPPSLASLKGLFEANLWQIALDASRPLTIRAHCQQLIRDFIHDGVEQMFELGRTSPEDEALAEANLREFISLMRTQAQKLGHPDWIGEDTFWGTITFLESMRLNLFPFWPWGRRQQ